MGSKIERGAKRPLSTDKQGEISSSVDHRKTEKTNDDTMGHVAISKRSTTLSDWPYIDSQSPLPELQNKQRHTYRHRWYQPFQLSSVLLTVHDDQTAFQ